MAKTISLELLILHIWLAVFVWQASKVVYTIGIEIIPYTHQLDTISNTFCKSSFLQATSTQRSQLVSWLGVNCLLYQPFFILSFRFVRNFWFRRCCQSQSRSHASICRMSMWLCLNSAFQCIGAVIGAGILHGSTPLEVSGSLGANGLGPNNVTGVGLVSVTPGAGNHFSQS